MTDKYLHFRLGNVNTQSEIFGDFLKVDFYLNSQQPSKTFVDEIPDPAVEVLSLECLTADQESGH